MKLHEILNENDFDPADAYEEPDRSVTVELWHPDDEDGDTYVEVELEADIYVEPTEYEGQYVFSRGSFEVNGLEIATTFQFLGKEYKAGQPFPDELIPYVEGGDVDVKDFPAYIDKQLDGKIEIPSKHYPDSRSL